MQTLVARIPRRWLNSARRGGKLAVRLVLGLLALLAPVVWGGCSSAQPEPALQTEAWYRLKHRQSVTNAATYQQRTSEMMARLKRNDDRQNLAHWGAVENRRRQSIAQQKQRDRELDRFYARYQLRFTP